jgi:2-dehydropantoate 2-reductase
MKIAVVGCGAVGSYYGAMLARDYHEVHFLLRSDYDVVRRNGVQIRSPKGDFTVRPKCARAPEEIGTCELVLIGLKTTANGQFESLLPSLVGSGTTLITLQNGLGNEERLARYFSPAQIMGGLCFVCLNRLQPGLIQHLDYGLVVVGEFQGWPEPRTHNIAEAFRHAGIPCKVTDNLKRAHWEKLVWNVPFNGLGVASSAGFEAVVNGSLRAHAVLGECLTTDRLLTDPGWEKLVRELMLEIIAGARALKLDVEPALAEKQIARTRTMGAYKPSTLIDFERGQPLELDSLFLEPLRQAQSAGVAMPRLSALSEVLRALENAKT